MRASFTEALSQEHNDLILSSISELQRGLRLGKLVSH